MSALTAWGVRAGQRCSHPSLSGKASWRTLGTGQGGKASLQRKQVQSLGVLSLSGWQTAQSAEGMGSLGGTGAGVRLRAIWGWVSGFCQLLLACLQACWLPTCPNTHARMHARTHTHTHTSSLTLNADMATHTPSTVHLHQPHEPPSL